MQQPVPRGRDRAPAPAASAVRHRPGQLPAAGRRPLPARRTTAGESERASGGPVLRTPSPSSASAASQRSATARSSPAMAGAMRPADAHVALAVFELNRPPLAHAREQLARRVRDGHVHVLPDRGEQRGDLRRAACRARTPSRRTPAPSPETAGAGRSPSAPGYSRSALLNAVRRGLSPAPSSSRTVWTVARCSGDMGVGGVHHLDQDVRAGDLLQRGAEGVDELVRELVDEAHGVGHDRRLAVARASPGARSGRGWRTACPRPSPPRCRPGR